MGTQYGGGAQKPSITQWGQGKVATDECEECRRVYCEGGGEAEG